jgi:deuterolysin
MHTDTRVTGQAVAFEGVHVHIDRTTLAQTEKKVIAAGQSVNTTFDVAHLYDLSKSGSYDVIARGTLIAVDEEGNASGEIDYESDKIQVSIDGTKAADERTRSIERRTITHSDCTGVKRLAIDIALANCRTMAVNARDQAIYGDSDRFEEYFMTTDSITRYVVSDVFQRVADNCGTATFGFSRTYCTDVYDGCHGAIALTYSGSSEMVLCPGFFNGQSGLTEECHTGDRASVMVHESTHLKEVMGTDDVAYGYDGIRRLTTEQALNNADSYTYFSHSFYESCYNSTLFDVRGCVERDFRDICVHVKAPSKF